MNEAINLANRFREPLLNGKWVAFTNFKEQLADITYKQATTKINGLNSIAALTFHIDYYVAGVLQVFNGGTLDIRDKYSFDMPAIESEEDWKRLREQLWIHAEQFAEAVEKMSTNQLNAVFVKEEYGDFRRSIDGMIEHAYYHLGQVVLIKKMITQPSAIN